MTKLELVTNELIASAHTTINQERLECASSPPIHFVHFTENLQGGRNGTESSPN